MPPPYKPVGRCIYCGTEIYSPDEPSRKLGDEHIIPQGFLGTAVLPDASCQEHERETSKIEDHCTRHLLGRARPHLGLKGRKSRRVPTHAPFIGDSKSELKIPTEKHPGYIIDFTYPYPNILLGRRRVVQAPDEGVLIHVRPVVRDFEQRVRNLGGDIDVKLAEKKSIQIFAQMLAKIAHVFTVAELGTDRFEPWLPPLILGKDSEFGIGDLIGTGTFDEPPSADKNEVRFVPALSGPANLIVVRVRLFANIERASRAHYVVAGRPV